MIIKQITNKKFEYSEELKININNYLVKKKIDIDKLNQGNNINIEIEHEIIDSSMLEGIFFNFDDYYSQNSKNINSLKIQQDIKIIKSIFNNKKSITNLIKDDFSKQYLRDLHSLFFNDSKELLEPNTNIGKFRDNDNYIINGLKPVEVNQIQNKLKNLLVYFNTKINKNDLLEIIIRTSYIHGEFERIHPFEDGNGRIGRLLVNIYLSKQLGYPYFLNFSNLLNIFREDYISKLNSIDKDKKILLNKDEKVWDEWLSYFTKILIDSISKSIDNNKDKK